MNLEKRKVCGGRMSDPLFHLVFSGAVGTAGQSGIEFISHDPLINCKSAGGKIAYKAGQFIFWGVIGGLGTDSDHLVSVVMKGLPVTYNNLALYGGKWGHVPLLLACLAVFLCTGILFLKTQFRHGTKLPTSGRHFALSAGLLFSVMAHLSSDYLFYCIRGICRLEPLGSDAVKMLIMLFR
ncbi:hypothetical protein A2Z33_06440 [Candidatus Gottesmanbacteria bacterium RBG_16_52_11]|uniref:Uncharacterized protein n=1 Tax=Candidatus Gottesmanbacteria bacterium RBG_16_52_11 TaxID=1798374 RepID=A0A1F5YXI2_9BACT|nr:MAG: hypothetical protein A2Z33_06440 [Candidatus Gottesmanbacteria bacterium RBG_16_52_11]